MYLILESTEKICSSEPLYMITHSIAGIMILLLRDHLSIRAIFPIFLCIYRLLLQQLFLVLAGWLTDGQESKIHFFLSWHVFFYFLSVSGWWPAIFFPSLAAADVISSIFVHICTIILIITTTKKRKTKKNLVSHFSIVIIMLMCMTFLFLLLLLFSVYFALYTYVCMYMYTAYRLHMYMGMCLCVWICKFMWARVCVFCLVTINKSFVICFCCL